MDLKECLEQIYQQDKEKTETIEYQRSQIETLKSEQYRDEELQRMKEKFESLKADYIRGFPITEKEQMAIEAWREQHEAICRFHNKSGFSGRYSYKFEPTSIGTFGTIRCSCGAEYEFQTSK